MQTITQFALIAIAASAATLRPVNVANPHMPTPKPQFLDCGLNREACIKDGIIKTNVKKNIASRQLSRNNREMLNFAQTSAPFESVYEPTHDQLLVLYDPIFAEYSTNGKMSRGQWSDLLDNYRLAPEDKDCKKHQKKSWGGMKKKVWWTCDYGKERHYTAMDTQGGDEGLNYNQFLTSLESMNWEMHTEDDEAEDFVYTKLTDAQIEAEKLVSIKYEYIPKFEDAGNGNGNWKNSVTIEKGRSTEEEVSHATMYRVSASASWGGGEASAEY